MTMKRWTATVLVMTAFHYRREHLNGQSATMDSWQAMKKFRSYATSRVKEDWKQDEYTVTEDEAILLCVHAWHDLNRHKTTLARL